MTIYFVGLVLAFSLVLNRALLSFILKRCDGPGCYCKHLTNIHVHRYGLTGEDVPEQHDHFEYSANVGSKRAKDLTSAQRALQKGNTDEAIRLYQEVVKNDPSDLRTLLKVGDLQAKVGNVAEANETYRRVGERYAEDGFLLKATAVFRQILKLDPAMISVYIRIAEVSQKLGLNSEAMKHYQVVVRHYENQGLKKESLDILEKMAELEPDNIAGRVKLAELYQREGLLTEARRNYQVALSQYEQQGLEKHVMEINQALDDLGKENHQRTS